MMWCCAQGGKRDGVGTGAVEGSLGKYRNASVKGKNRVHVSKWNVIRNFPYAI